MLDNTITLPVDTLNNGVPVNRTYKRMEEYTSRSVYKGPAHTLSLRDTMGFYRSPVNRSGNFLGVAKSAMKLTQDTVVAGADGTNLVKPMIGDVLFSIPVGTSPATTLEFRQRMIAMIDHAIAAQLVDELEI